MRLIDVDALLERMEKRFSDLAVEYGSRDSYVSGFDEGMVAVDDAPTIDAVPVVRCKDCKHRGKAGECPMCFIETYTFDEGDGYMCSGYDDHDNTQDGGFCDMGERRCDDA